MFPISGGIPLYMECYPVGTIPLYIPGHNFQEQGSLFGYIPLYIGTTGTFNNIPLYVRGEGVLDNGQPHRSRIDLYIHTTQVGNAIPLFMQVIEGSLNSSITLSILAGNTNFNSGIPLFITGVGPLYNTTTLSIYGY